MLIAISDIHFVDGTAGEHNLPYGAFKSVFLFDLAALAKDKKAKELKILLLGDIVDIIRSTRWFDKGLLDRPWGKKGMSDVLSPKRTAPLKSSACKYSVRSRTRISTQAGLQHIWKMTLSSVRTGTPSSYSVTCLQC